MTIKKIIGKVHLWLGFTSGIIVFIIAVTGCLYAFQAEITNMTTSSFRKVAPQNAAFLPPTQVKEIVEKQLPGKHVHSVQYGAKDEALVATFYSAEPEYYYLIYVNPYSGEVLRVKNMDRDFFRIVLMGHYYLWLPDEIGQRIVIYATIIFVLMMITGLILWWPRNKAAAKQRFSIKWNAAWRRKNYDLHNVLGFYMTWVVIFMAITGLVFGWQLLANAIYKGAGGKKSLVYQEPFSDTTKVAQATAITLPVDKLWLQMQQEHKEAEIIEMHFPATTRSSIEVAINTDADTYWRTDYRFFDQYSLNELPVEHIYGRFKDAKGADKLLRMNYDIHIGAIGGVPGKILAFFASLIAASLPITGFMIWWGRRKKKPSR
ncbi:PepSY domain-containing protein [Niastella caeni]|uniref:PepSY domain-containing protein n=1 Tax=Niastella caeni TaxID=2569763 RepID=A0A4S8HQT5_9BACT|nr:PepSY-associated TM helix domain-containing protein [Niastella caeni]THU37241.1 PepSY domain-containing protein [Niastella caeni]